MKVPCSVQLTYPHDRNGKEINIRVMDEKSGLIVVDVRIDGSKAIDLFSVSTVEGDAFIPDEAKTLWGKKRETMKHVLGFVPERNTFQEQVNEAIPELIADGWELHWTEYNHHHVKSGGYEVTLIRWVDVQP